MIKYLIVLDRRTFILNCEEVASYILDNFKNGTISSFNDVIYDFNRGELGTLNYLSTCGMLPTAGDLSKELKVSTARIARILNTLEEKKCIRRIADNKDKRKILVKITDTGLCQISKLQTDLVQKIGYVISELGEEETLEYLRISKKISDILNNKF